MALAQSIFQVGGNFGSSTGPLLAAVIIAPYGKGNVARFVLAALLAIVVLAQISRWYSAQHRMNKGKPKATIINPLPRNKVVLAVSILLILIFSKYFYMASISSYYTFYLMQKFGLSIQNAQLHLFAFLFAVAAGTVIGGPVGDKIGRKYVIWGSILGVAPFTLILPYASLHWTGVLTVIIDLSSLRHSLPFWSMPVSCFRDVSVWFLDYFSVLLSAWEVWGRQFWGLSPTTPA